MTLSPEQTDLLRRMYPYRRLSRAAFHGQPFRIEDTKSFYDESLVLDMVEKGVLRVAQEGRGKGKPCPFTVLLSPAGQTLRDEIMAVDGLFDED